MANEIIGIVPTIQAVGLAGHNVKFVKKPKKSIGDFTGIAVENIVGTELIKTQSNIIAGL